jgi:uncharacterized membrane protein
MGSGPSGRLRWLDLARGLCVLLMIQMHAFYAWVREEDRGTALFSWTWRVGGYPGAVFLFLAGLVLALGSESAAARGTRGRARLGRGLRRGLEVLGYAALFRLGMFASGGFDRPFDLLRVDILNAIAAGLLLAAAAGLPWGDWRARAAAPVALAVAMALATPLAWDGGITEGWPAPLAAYLNGREKPLAFFPVLPWSAFAVLGGAAGVLLARALRAGRERAFVAACAALGAVTIALAVWASRTVPSLYEPRADFWHTSPLFFAIKAGIVLVVLAAAWALDRAPGTGWLRQLGRTSLLVYWAHLEIVYGDHVIPGWRGRLSVETAAAGVTGLTALMWALSVAREKVPGGILPPAWFSWPPAWPRRRPPRAA